jgi:hypothetical protein
MVDAKFSLLLAKFLHNAARDRRLYSEGSNPSLSAMTI